MTLKGDAAKGKQLAYTCMGCHGITGYKNAYPSYHVPRIGGQSAQYLASALNEYREGKRKHATMQAQAQSFSAQDIADIAAYLSSIKTTRSEPRHDDQERPARHRAADPRARRLLQPGSRRP